MSVLVPVPAFGRGTTEVESFLSVLHRTAEVYRVRFARLGELLSGMHSPATFNLNGLPTHCPFIGYSSMTAAYVQSLQRLTDTSGYEHHTFLKLTPVLARNCSGVFTREHRWCPECLNPSRGIEYGLLAHQMLFIRRCPLHECELLDRCQECGSTRDYRTNGPTSRHCGRCGSRLWLQKAAKSLPRISYADWRERQALDLLCYLSDPQRPPPAADWCQQLKAGLDSLYHAPHHQYSRQEIHFLLPRMRATFCFPQLDTLMRLAAVQAVHVVDLILAPQQSCTPRLLDIGSIRNRPRQRNRIPATHWVALKAVIEALLLTDSSGMLPSKASICRHTALLPSGFWQHYPELSVQYENERMKRSKAIRSLGFDRIYSQAMKELVERQVGSDGINIRKDGAFLSKKTAVPKHVVESALRAAKLTWDFLEPEHRSNLKAEPQTPVRALPGS